MTAQRPSARASLSRRSALGLLGAAPLAASGAVGLTACARASTGHVGTSGGPPPALLPGGAFDQYVSGLAAKDQFSGTVLLGWHGKPVLVHSFHEADKAKHIPNQADTIFYLESTTKFLTGVAVTQLAAQGKVDFSAPLGTYLDGFPAEIAKTVTVHNLLTHTSGFPVNLIGTRGKSTTQAEAFNANLAAARKLKLATAPGTTYAYNNDNYFLATAIIAAVSGQPYWDYMPEHVFGPAGMTSTGLYSDQQWLTDPRIAHIYGPPVAGGQRQDVTSQAFGGPDVDEIFSTAPDMLRFANALTDGTLLPPGWAELRAGGRFPVIPDRMDPDAPVTSKSFMVGYGSDERITAGGQRAYSHSGGVHTGGAHSGEGRVPVTRSSPSARANTGGANTIMTIYPDLGVTAVVLTNYSLTPVGDTSGFLARQDGIVTATHPDPWLPAG
jgi:CubicO group peptidase (beta-lactamase class C family)